MRRQHGAARKLTDAQVARVMTRQAKWRQFLSSHGTAHDLAKRLGVRVDVVRRCIRRKEEYLQRPEILWLMGDHLTDWSLPWPRRRGRPGLTDAKRAMVLKWHQAFLEVGRERGSTKRLALELGISENTLRNCIGRNGVYKKPYQHERVPKKSDVRPVTRRRRDESRRRFHTGTDVQLRIAAMQRWQRGGA
jgi:hypothetical protein